MGRGQHVSEVRTKKSRCLLFLVRSSEEVEVKMKDVADFKLPDTAQSGDTGNIPIIFLISLEYPLSLDFFFS
jgi:hypothetical protein